MPSAIPTPTSQKTFSFSERAAAAALGWCYIARPRYCLAYARCSVFAVPPSALMDEMRLGLRSWQFRRHALIPDTPEA